jgi:hypothetical protein
MPEMPKEAPESVRFRVIDALRDSTRWFLDQKSSSRNYLDLWNLRASTFVADLADGLERGGRLFLKHSQQSGHTQRYQCVLAYPEEESYPPIDIHVTLSPRGEPPQVKIAVHPSDTVRTLPRIQAIPPNHEDNPPQT